MNSSDDSVNNIRRRSFIKGAGSLVAAGAFVSVAGVSTKALATDNKASRPSNDYDVIVIGGGYAGVTAARNLANAY